MKQGVIYQIKSPSGKIYIGQTVNLYIREIHYRKLHCYKQRKIYNSLLKYGFDSHEFNVLETCERSLLNEREKYWINFYNSVENGMNLTYGGDCFIRSKETNKILSDGKIGSNNPMFGKVKELHHNYGKKASEITLKRLRDSHLGIKAGKDNSFFKGFVQAFKNDVFIGEYEGVIDAANKLNLQHPNISKVILGKRSHTGGYVFKRDLNIYTS